MSLSVACWGSPWDLRLPRHGSEAYTFLLIRFACPHQPEPAGLGIGEQRMRGAEERGSGMHTNIQWSSVVYYIM